MKIQVLDHGYVEFVEAWGTGHGGKKHGLDRPIVAPSSEPFMKQADYEVGIIEAARQSTQGSFRGWEPAACDCVEGSITENHPGKAIHADDCASVKSPGDARLLSYLYNNKHMTPFEFSGMVLEIQAPIFVFREWHRHRTQSYNEASARYAPLPDLNYVPTVERVMANATGNKQAGAVTDVDKEMSEANARQFIQMLQLQYDFAEEKYQKALRHSVPKELARLVLPVGRYSKMRASANLRNWLAFLTLRLDPAAQWEIRQYAKAVEDIMHEKFPHVMRLVGHS